ncbi:hypothetical protein NMY22_g3948 [Coprinellus aureogranulatus]|nr:hypothetical protein NMY22_g3948 [Coprinellus aureogranulatus]
MKGIGKALARTPFAVTSRIGMAKRTLAAVFTLYLLWSIARPLESTDPEFDDWHRQFQAIETGTEKLLKDTKAFTEAVTTLFTAGAGWATHFATIFEPLSGEYDLIGKHPECGQTIRNVTKYLGHMEELRSLIAPELELIQTRVYAPVKEFQTIVKTIRKSIVKRDHKLVDYDRFNNSLTKLRDKKERSLSDEKNLFKLEQDFEIATNEYEYINNALKQDLPRFMQLATHFIDPLFNSFYYMQLNIYYLILEKMQSFADEGKYDITNAPGSVIQQDYENKRTDAWEHIENLQIVKRIISVSKLVQANRAAQGGTGLSRANTSTSSTSSFGSRTAPPPSRAATVGSSFKKAPPPPPPSSSYSAAPPPYSPAASSSSVASVAATKRAPPPPPPLKPKPKPPVPQAVYVTAIYDFDAQAEGDLSFREGDRIELVKKTDSQEDWWTGRLNGREGVFPGCNGMVLIGWEAMRKAADKQQATEGSSGAGLALAVLCANHVLLVPQSLSLPLSPCLPPHTTMLDPVRDIPKSDDVCSPVSYNAIFTPPSNTRPPKLPVYVARGCSPNCCETTGRSQGGEAKTEAQANEGGNDDGECYAFSTAIPDPFCTPQEATPAAVSRLRSLLNGPTPQLIRVGVRNKGCAGMSYHLEYVEKPGKFDEIVEQDGVKVLIDSKALFSIIGSEMDWKEDSLSSKFVFHNPNIKDACGCGESFTVGS